MKVSALHLLCAALQIICRASESHWMLLSNVLVLEVNGSGSQFPLSCLHEPGERLQKRNGSDEDIFWKRNGVSEPERGNVFHIQLIESLGGGNYTCHGADDSLLNYTEVLILQEDTTSRKILVKAEGDDYLKCSARNYSGEFHCSWTWDERRVGNVAFIIAQRFSGSNSTQGQISCSVDDRGNGISCVDEQHCPYAEENTPIHITVYVKTEHFLVESYSKLFFVSNIVKPEKVRIERVNTTAIEWSYPSSWSRPHSYFPLSFQIAQYRSRPEKCGDVEPSMNVIVDLTDSCQFKVKRRTRAVCVRAKDALCNSQWSEWSCIRLTRPKRNKERYHRRRA